MKKLLLGAAAMLLLIPTPSGAICTSLATGLKLDIPNFNDPWQIWSQCMRDNFLTINDSAASTTSVSLAGALSINTTDGFVLFVTTADGGPIISTTTADALGLIFNPGLRITNGLTLVSTWTTSVFDHAGSGLFAGDVIVAGKITGGSNTPISNAAIEGQSNNGQGEPVGVFLNPPLFDNRQTGIMFGFGTGNNQAGRVVFRKVNPQDQQTVIIGITASNNKVEETLIIRDGFKVGIATGQPQVTFEVEGVSMFGTGSEKSTFTATGLLRLSTGVVVGAGPLVLSDGFEIHDQGDLGVGGDFSNGGEAGGANRSLGNTDAFDLTFITNNTPRLSIDRANGSLTLIGSSSMSIPSGSLSIGTVDLVVTGGRVGISTGTPQVTFEVEGTSMFGTGANKSTFTVTGFLDLSTGIAVGPGAPLILQDGTELFGAGDVGGSADKLPLAGGIITGLVTFDDANINLTGTGKVQIDGGTILSSDHRVVVEDGTCAAPGLQFVDGFGNNGFALLTENLSVCSGGLRTTEFLDAGTTLYTALHLNGLFTSASSFITVGDVTANTFFGDGSNLTGIGGGGGDFADGGDAGGAARTLGNTDQFDLSFLTDNIKRLTIGDTGSITFFNSSSTFRGNTASTTTVLINNTGVGDANLTLRSFATAAIGHIVGSLDFVRTFDSTNKTRYAGIETTLGTINGFGSENGRMSLWTVENGIQKEGGRTQNGRMRLGDGQGGSCLANINAVAPFAWSTFPGCVGFTQFGGTENSSNASIHMEVWNGAGRTRMLEVIGTPTFEVKIGAGHDTIVSGEFEVTGVTGSGKVVCVKADGKFGVCSDAPGGSGTCTCG